MSAHSLENIPNNLQVEVSGTQEFQDLSFNLQEVFP